MASRRDEENLVKCGPDPLYGWRPFINATRQNGWPSSISRKRPACDASSSASSRTTSLTSWICRGYSDFLGDAHYFLGQPDEAKKSYDESLALARELSASEELLAINRALSLMLYKSATAALKLGNRSESQKLYDECLAIREQYSHAKPRDLEAAIDWMLALARCGKTELARTKAENLLKYVAAQGSGYQSAAIYPVAERLRAGHRRRQPRPGSPGRDVVARTARGAQEAHRSLVRGTGSGDRFRLRRPLPARNRSRHRRSSRRSTICGYS